MGLRHRCVLLALVVGFVLVGAACGDDGEGPPDASSPAADEPTLHVVGDGIVVVSADGSTSTTPFGTIEGDVVAEVLSVLGDPAEKVRDRECSPTAQYLTFPAITVWLSDGIFVGWTLGPDPEAVVVTPEGIGLGSTLADVEAAFDDVIVDPTSDAGIEFAADAAVFGTLDGSGPDARVESLRAGETCQGT